MWVQPQRLGPRQLQQNLLKLTPDPPPDHSGQVILSPDPELVSFRPISLPLIVFLLPLPLSSEDLFTCVLISRLRVLTGAQLWHL